MSVCLCVSRLALYIRLFSCFFFFFYMCLSSKLSLFLLVTQNTKPNNRAALFIVHRTLSYDFDYICISHYEDDYVGFEV